MKRAESSLISSTVLRLELLAQRRATLAGLAPLPMPDEAPVAEEGDYALTRPYSRTPSRIVDAHAAELLNEFRKSRSTRRRLGPGRFLLIRVRSGSRTHLLR